NKQVSVDIFALSEASSDEGRTAAAIQNDLQVSSTFAEGDEMGLAVSGRGAGYTEWQEVIAPINKIDAEVHRGGDFRVDVVVRTLGVGHFFPGGTVDAYDVWVELKAEDETGRTFFWSGFVPEDEHGRKGPVDPSAHFYRSRMLDERGNPINKRNAWATRSVAYVRLIPPGAADTVHYRIHVPEDIGNTIKLTARVNYRKFNWWNTQWAYAGERDPNDPDPEVSSGYDSGGWVFTADTSTVSGELKEIPDLPITVMAEATTKIRVADTKLKAPNLGSVLEKEDLLRWNDYGIGLLLQGDLKAAEQIFLKVTEISPEYADGWVNVGRARLLEGRTDEAQEALKTALELNPDLAKSHFFLGLTFKNQGEYEVALQHFLIASEQYPRDRVVLNQIGRILFLQREFEQAITLFQKVLAIDSEDLQAHYNLMLCYRALRNAELAEHQQALYLRFKADEDAQAILGPYLREHPHDNNERQAVHEHRSFPIEGKPMHATGTF
ncbi:MAG: tetratricopeptide repeat protein, partial [Acidobacteriota bacterium]